MKTDNQQTVNELRKLYPISTFSGTTQDELVELIEKQKHQAAVEALNDLFEYMGQFPDINLADMREWIKNFEEEE